MCLAAGIGGCTTESATPSAAARPDAGETTPDRDASPVTTGDAGGARDVQPNNPDAGLRPDATEQASEISGCVADELPCGVGDAGSECCFGTCFHGMCGECLAEGTRCDEVPGQTCCNDLVCNDGYCGTSLCVPDTTPCDGTSVVCCNDNCNNGTCGG